MKIKRLLLRLIPARFAPTRDRLTLSARWLLIRFALGTLGIVMAVASIFVLSPGSWREILAGAILASGVSIIAWSVSSYREGREDVRNELQRDAEYLLLHARLNHLAGKLGAKKLVLDLDLTDAIEFQMIRMAHLSDVEDFYPSSEQGYESDWWDNEAMGYDD